MKLKRAHEIRDYFEQIEEDDMSTELLLSLVSQHFKIMYGDVTEALCLTNPRGKEG